MPPVAGLEANTFKEYDDTFYPEPFEVCYKGNHWRKFRNFFFFFAG